MAGVAPGTSTTRWHDDRVELGNAPQPESVPRTLTDSPKSDLRKLDQTSSPVPSGSDCILVVVGWLSFSRRVLQQRLVDVTRRASRG